MKRETFKITDVIEEPSLHPDDWEEFIVVKEEQVGFDIEKGFAEYKIVIKRLSDGKFFEIEYTDFGRGQNDLFEQTASQVFPKTKTITYYE